MAPTPISICSSHSTAADFITLSRSAPASELTLKQPVSPSASRASAATICGFELREFCIRIRSGFQHSNFGLGSRSLLLACPLDLLLKRDVTLLNDSNVVLGRRAIHIDGQSRLLVCFDDQAIT